MNKKIMDRGELAELASVFKDRGRKVVFTNGCFDILHPGHIRYLKEARREGDILVVGVNSDSSVRRLKEAGRPVFPERDRAELLAALEMVDYVTIFDEDTPAELIEALKPDVLVKGADYEIDEIVGRETVERSGGRVVVVPLVEGYSTTGVIERIKRIGGGGQARR